jgi:hypothetical protein
MVSGPSKQRLSHTCSPLARRHTGWCRKGRLVRLRLGLAAPLHLDLSAPSHFHLGWCRIGGMGDSVTEERSMTKEHASP